MPDYVFRHQGIAVSFVDTVKSMCRGRPFDEGAAYRRNLDKVYVDGVPTKILEKAERRFQGSFRKFATA